MTAIEIRLRRIHEALTMIVLAARESEDSPIEHDEILRAIEATALEVRDEAYWLKLLPGSVLNMPCPTDEEVQARFGIKLGDEDYPDKLADGRERLIKEAIARLGEGGD